MAAILIVVALGVMFTRFTPFILMRSNKISEKFNFLLNGIPYATISLLVVYAFKDIDGSNLWASLVGTVVCVVLYVWKRNTILSILVSTILYMLIFQNM
ncbi:MAG: AzlD domain-containing protein [Erysipelothrix sp.]|jgi:branched-subunit amino acid transport protein AzlD|nr:AzlD domain-containing protein [Erysipelothrix sp.]